MPAEWKTLTILDAGVSLIDCEHRTPPAAIAGFPYVAIPQLKAGRLDLSNARQISPEHFRDWTRKACPQTHDVILSRRCNPGETAFVPPGLQCALGQNLVLLRADGTKVYPPFLRWLVRGEEWWEQIRKFLNSGAVFDSLKCADIPRFRLPIPPLNEQEAIAATLGVLDQKIELNRRMNETLEAIALAIFKSWFVDFDPVRAKAEGRENSLAEHVADAFPGNFVDSELGLIPGGWGVGTLYERAEYINGLAFRSEDFSQGRLGLPVIKIGELKDGITRQTRFTLKDLDPKYQIKSGDILFAWSGSPDTSIDIFIWSGIDGWLNQHIFKIEAQQSEERIFLYFLLRFFKPVFIEVARNKQTTGLGHVTAGDLRRLKTPVPSKDALRAFNRVAEPLFQRAYCCRQESVNLAAIRDALLPKLMSGEIRIRQAEKIVEVQP